MPIDSSGTDSILALVDGGATGTRVRLHDAAGVRLGEGSAGPSSLTLGVDQAWRNVSAAVEAAARAAGLPDLARMPLRLAAGLAGARSPGNRDRFRAADPFGCEEIRIFTDGYSSLIGALGGEPGTVLAIGTGVTAYSLKADGRCVEASGWGFPAGDEGGGAWIGHRALQAYLKWLDGRLTEDSAVFDALPALIGADFDAIQRWLAAARVTEYASLAPAVVTAATTGDTLAERILDRAAAELDETIAAVEADGPEPRVALLGGLSATFAPRLSESVRARLVPARGSALDGLLILMTRQGAWRQLA